MNPETPPPAGVFPAPSLQRYDAFLSYARKDAAFALALVDLLRRGGFEVWLDEERITGGQRPQEIIRAALRGSAALLCLVSRHWLESDYCDWEAEVFSNELGRQRLMIPVLRMPRRPADLPVYLNRLNAISWLDPKPSEELFWWVRCALLKEEQGPRSEWLERGRQALGGLAAVAIRRSARLSAEQEEEARRRSRWDRAVLLCDRAPQWHEIDIHAPLPRHEALFVQGAQVEAPDVFLDAVERCFPESPARRVVPVPWNDSLPRTRGQFREGLATALSCAEPDLERVLRDWLWDCNLVLVHRPVLQKVLEEEPLRDYYRGLLPQLLPNGGETRGFAKIVQGVAWTPSHPVSSRLARLAKRFWRRRAAWIERALERSRAEEVLKYLRNRSDPLPLIVLPPLQPITPEDVEIWSESLGPGKDSAAAVRDVLRGARTSAEILVRANAYASPREESA